MNRRQTPAGGRPIAPLLLIGCLALAVAAALAPAAMFALTDAAQFDRARSISTPYTAQQPDRNDYYLLRMLHARREAFLQTSSANPRDGLYLGAQTSMNQMQQDSTLADRAQTMLAELVGAGVLPQAWVDSINAEIGENIWSYYGSTDSLGFLHISYFVGSDTDTPYLLFSLTIETHTQKIVSLFATSAQELPGPDPAAALPAWLALNELDDLGDWAAPQGSYYEDTSLWSARGELLASCTAHNFQDYRPTGDVTRRYLSLSLNPCSLDDLAGGQRSDQSWATPETAAPLPTGFTVGHLTRLFYGNGVNTGSAYYEITDAAPGDAGGLVLRTDYAAASQSCLCSIPGCAHNTDACPAHLPYRYNQQLCQVGDTLYLCGASYTSELMRRQTGESAPTPDPTLSAEDLQSWNNYQAYLKEPSCIDAFSADGTTRRRVLNFPQGMNLTYFAVDDRAIYAFYSETESSLSRLIGVRADPVSGSYTSFPLLSGEWPVGVYDRCWVTTRTVCDQDLYALWYGSDYDAYYAVAQNADTLYSLYDPATGARRAITTMASSDTSYSFMRVQGDLLLFNRLQSAADNSVSGAELYGISIETGQPRRFADPLLPNAFWPDACDFAPVGSAVASPWLVFRGDSDSSGYLFNLTTGKRSSITQRANFSGYRSLARPVAQAADGRFLICTGDLSGPAYSHPLYALIAPDAYLAGSTAWQAVMPYSAGG